MQVLKTASRTDHPSLAPCDRDCAGPDTVSREEDVDRPEGSGQALHPCAGAPVSVEIRAARELGKMHPTQPT